MAEFGRTWPNRRSRAARRRGGGGKPPRNWVGSGLCNPRTPGTWRCWRIVDAARDRQHHLSGIGGCRGESRNWQGTGEELAGTGRNWQESGQNLLRRRLIYRKGVVFETNLAKSDDKSVSRVQNCARRAQKGPGGDPEPPKRAFGGARSPPGGQKGEKVLFLGSLFGSKMGHNPLKSDLEITKKQ